MTTILHRESNETFEITVRELLPLFGGKKSYAVVTVDRKFGATLKHVSAETKSLAMVAFDRLATEFFSEWEENPYNN